jgi:hypothetical protein
MPTDALHRMDTRSRRTRRDVVLILATAVALALALSGCGSSTPGSTVVGATTTVVARGQAGPGPLAGTTYAISVALGKLSKTSLQVPAGSGVLFINGEDDTTTQHELVADDGSFDTMALDPGAQYYVYFAGLGTVTFHDVLSPDIKGQIVIVPGDTLLGEGNLPTGPWIGVGKDGFSATKTQARVQDNVTFFNSEDDNTVTHRIVADDGSFDSGVLTPGQTYSVTFASSGTYSFHDAQNPSFKGTITIK